MVAVNWTSMTSAPGIDSTRSADRRIRLPSTGAELYGSLARPTASGLDTGGIRLTAASDT